MGAEEIINLQGATLDLAMATGSDLARSAMVAGSAVRGFNLGTNIGKVSGQSIHHCHFHIIPRREGDVENPQGGVRSVIPSKQHYKRKK